ncbi:MAG: helix-turn-helix transcriptional regulator, partial [Clostridia bacterium]|nr:helix-turn-helix transcriptional regulator [Clostridia bacterium]
VQLSRSRFSVLYQKIFHVSPIRDLIRARIERACYYLSSGTQSIPEIAELCGYQNEYHFIRQFKEETGMTPGAFRNK